MTFVIIALALVVALVIAYNLNKKPVQKQETIVVPDKIEPPVVVEAVKVVESVLTPAPKKRVVKKATEKKELVKKATKKTK